VKRPNSINVPLRLVLDETKCDGHGICTLRCPELISIDEWGYAVVSSEPIVRRRTLTHATRAMRACPESALTLLAVEVAPERATTPMVG
jgi:ferredoxin